jgi:DNA-binding beta-propeller fold protein YncE
MSTHPSFFLSATLLALSLGIAGCSMKGDDGDKGDTGTTGVTGAADAGVELRFLGRFQHKDAGSVVGFDVGAAEITAYDALSMRLVVINAKIGAIDVLNYADPTAPALIQSVDVGALVEAARSLPNTDLGGVNSVAIRGGIAAVAVEATVKTDPGYVAFVNVATLALVGSVKVGALPDMVTFSPDGKYVVTADEGEPSNGYVANPPGTISVINVTGGYASATVATAGFTAWDVGGAKNAEVAGLRTAGLRFDTITGAAATFSQDMEPEYVAVAPDSATAYVTLQENNSIAVVDLATATVSKIMPLGFKDHGIPGNELDVSDRDVDGTSGGGGLINIRTWPGVVGAFMPDGISCYKVGNTTYLVTANEGDGRDYASGGFGATFADEITVFAKFGAATTAGPLTGRLAGLEGNDKLGRLTILNDLSTPSRIVAYGARSFTIWDAATGARIWDSGSEIERQVANRFPANFNVSSTSNTLDNRSDNKGPEPEGLAIGTIGTTTYAFIGLERIGGVMVYDITNPQAPSFVSFTNERKFSETPAAGKGGDLAPEGIHFIPAGSSPTGKALLVVGNETSGTSTVYQVADLVGGNG